MKKFFLIIAIIVITVSVITGCKKNKTFTSETDIKIHTPGESDSYTNIHEDDLPAFAAEKTLGIQIGFSRDRNLAFWIIHDFDENGSFIDGIAITTDTTLKDFRFIAINNHDDGSWSVERTLYSIAELKSSDQMEAFQVSTDINSRIPTRGISYLDGNTRKYLYISQSGFDGSLSLNEFQPSTAQTQTAQIAANIPPNIVDIINKRIEAIENGDIAAFRDTLAPYEDNSDYNFQFRILATCFGDLFGINSDTAIKALMNGDDVSEYARFLFHGVHRPVNRNTGLRITKIERNDAYGYNVTVVDNRLQENIFSFMFSSF